MTQVDNINELTAIAAKCTRPIDCFIKPKTQLAYAKGGKLEIQVLPEWTTIDGLSKWRYNVYIDNIKIPRSYEETEKKLKQAIQEGRLFIYELSTLIGTGKIPCIWGCAK